MTVKATIAQLRKDIAAIEWVKVGDGVIVESGWPERMRTVLESHERLEAALRRIMDCDCRRDLCAACGRGAYLALVKLEKE